MKIWLCFASMILAFLGTLLLRRYALAKQIIDVPNARSSHTVPTPRGGGVAIVLAFLLILTGWFLYGDMATDLFWALLPGGALVAIVGFWDDHSSLSAKLRFSFHLLAAAWAVFCLGGWPSLDLGFTSFAWGWFGAGVAGLALAWAINLYNFMDGIDGLAGMQAVFVGGAGGALLWLAGADGMPLFLLAAASTGFLLLNWPPARIFMGDAGSGFLGYSFGVMALHATALGTTAIWPWTILLGVFLVDATLTLVRRGLRGIRVTDAHRTHAYQWASRRLGAHKPVTLSVLLINIFLLLPLALASMVWPLWALLFAGLSLAALIWLAWRFDAGLPESDKINA
ncbi:glycosyltransferase family 4 protein [Uliginosibacterium flavum]|uniref:Glycosyltransferase family 4 protein n=1 Tax=Uliginosibacterium flavum TaxID=1396831 RepID=A0ABV2THX9_9RHOO